MNISLKNLNCTNLVLYVKYIPRIIKGAIKTYVHKKSFTFPIKLLKKIIYIPPKNKKMSKYAFIVLYIIRKKKANVIIFINHICFLYI